MDKTKRTLIYFLAQYGNDFFDKLPKYKTAKYTGWDNLLRGDFVSLLVFYPETLEFEITKKSWGSVSKIVSVFDLDEFVL